ncbi:MAG: response regulator transcription factor [Flavobacteriaceae bacterium]|nr:response regulator transcription factor [Flavobacteriaceae bacterium]
MLRTCIIIEDQPPAQRILQKYIGDIVTLELKATFSNALEAIPFLQEHTIDLIFLDIHLPKISGLEFLKTLKDSPQIILTTAFSDYALESYEFNVVDYLLKPISFQRFVQAVTKSNELVTSNATLAKKEEELQTAFFIKSGYDIFKISSEAILFIKSDADYSEVVTKQKTYLSTDSLKHWLQKLGPHFYQVHKSYIVNTQHLEKISSNQIHLNTHHIIPIGRAYKSHFTNGFLNS